MLNTSTCFLLTDCKPLPGWLELRKGFHTLLTEGGELVVLRDGEQ